MVSLAQSRFSATQGKAYARWLVAEARHSQARESQDKANQRAKRAHKAAQEVGAVDGLCRFTMSSRAGKVRWYYVPLTVFFAPGIRERTHYYRCNGQGSCYAMLSQVVGIVEQV